MLGGNIGTPLVERLPELTPATGSSSSCRSSSCRPCRAGRPSRSTPTSPRTTSTGTARSRPTARSSAACRARRPGRRARAQRRGPGRRRATPACGTAPSVSYRRDRPCPAGSASSTAGSSPRASSGCRWPAAGPRRPDRAAGSCRSASWPLPGAHNVTNALAAVAVGLLFGIAPDAHPRGRRRRSPGVEHRLEPVARHRRRPLRQRLAGHAARRGHRRAARFEPPLVLIAGGRDKGVDLSALPPVVAERAAAAVAHRRERPGSRTALPRRRPARASRRPATLDAAVRRADELARERPGRRRSGAGPATVLLSPAAASFDMFVDYAARGRAFKAAVAALAAERAPSDRPRGGPDEPRTADPALRSSGPGRSASRDRARAGPRRPGAAADRTPAKSPTPGPPARAPPARLPRSSSRSSRSPRSAS